MNKSTIFFGSLALFLSVAIVTTGWGIVNYRPAESKVGGIFNDLSLPVSGIKNEEKIFEATSVLLWDDQEDTIKYEQNAFERRPIASITKLMTAMVALDQGIDWEISANILPAEYTIGSTFYLSSNETVTVKDLFYASLVGSANNATKAYVRLLGHKEDEFVQAMNRKAIELGLEQTSFTEITGLDPGNVSTAYEVAKLASYAWKNYPEISQASSLSEYEITTSSGRKHTLRNSTKPVRRGEMLVTGTKTGYLHEAGYCLVVQGAGDLRNRIAVILNSPSEEKHFSDIKRLLKLQLL